MTVAAAWSDDVPGPGEVGDAQAEWDALVALQRERERLRGVEQPTPEPTTWEPQNPLARALWRALPADGRGVEYVGLVRYVQQQLGCPLVHVQAALAGLVLTGKAYVTGAPQAGVSMAGRGPEPRVGCVGYRTGALDRGW